MHTVRDGCNAQQPYQCWPKKCGRGWLIASTCSLFNMHIITESLQGPALRLKRCAQEGLFILHVHGVMTEMVRSRGIDLLSCLTYISRAAWPCVGSQLWWQLSEESPSAYKQQPIFLPFICQGKPTLLCHRKVTKNDFSQGFWSLMHDLASHLHMQHTRSSHARTTASICSAKEQDTTLTLHQYWTENRSHWSLGNNLLQSRAQGVESGLESLTHIIIWACAMCNQQ